MIVELPMRAKLFVASGTEFVWGNMLVPVSSIPKKVHVVDIDEPSSTYSPSVYEVVGEDYRLIYTEYFGRRISFLNLKN